MLLTTHRDRKHPEVIHRVFKNRVGNKEVITCSCPRCFDGGCCYTRQAFLDRQFKDEAVNLFRKPGQAAIDLRAIIQESMTKFYGVAASQLVSNKPYPPRFTYMMR
jgi:hypothetical protein